MTEAGIESIPLFAALSPRERTRVAAVTRSLQFEVGQVVVQEGEFAFNFYAIKEGMAEVRHRGEQMAVLRAGDVFGEMGVVRDDARRWTRRRRATVIVTSPTHALVIDGVDFRRLTEEIPALRDAVRATAAGRAAINGSG
ncbi:MAG TPA: cyclic nucleotide-binding domain-containing protein [Solirubrobacteraceae bacterium]|jgi:CRP-like cAMP-binding protein|nr:cyclic nucleotide-binding domain-containing protein [Solirubrobacteraceae bacterium]